MTLFWTIVTAVILLLAVPFARWIIRALSLRLAQWQRQASRAHKRREREEYIATYGDKISGALCRSRLYCLQYKPTQIARRAAGRGYLADYATCYRTVYLSGCGSMSHDYAIARLHAFWLERVPFLWDMLPMERCVALIREKLWHALLPRVVFSDRKDGLATRSRDDHLYYTDEEPLFRELYKKALKKISPRLETPQCDRCGQVALCRNDSAGNKIIINK